MRSSGWPRGSAARLLVCACACAAPWTPEGSPARATGRPRRQGSKPGGQMRNLDASSWHDDGDVNGHIDFSNQKDFSLSWFIPAGAQGDPSADIAFTLSWSTRFDWAAVGLHDHPDPDSGMPDAEVFMCTMNTAAAMGVCEAMNTQLGYVTPTVDPTNYLKVVSSSQKGGLNEVVFVRTLAKVASSPLSFDVTNSTMGLIYARGMWKGAPMSPGQAQGTPLAHADTDASQIPINFFDPNPKPGPAPPPPAPPPPPPKPKSPGVWPTRWDGNLTMAPTQAPGDELATGFFARLRYDASPDFDPRGCQRWDYFDMADGSPVRTELWVGTTIYNITKYPGRPRTCAKTEMMFGVLKPGWMSNLVYHGTHYLLRQRSHSLSGSGTRGRAGRGASALAPTYYSNYTLADVWQEDDPEGGHTIMWTKHNSSIAEPVRIVRALDIIHPDLLAVLEFDTFQPIGASFRNGTFAIDPSCTAPEPPAPPPAAGATPLMAAARGRLEEDMRRAKRKIPGSHVRGRSIAESITLMNAQHVRGLPAGARAVPCEEWTAAELTDFLTLLYRNRDVRFEDLYRGNKLRSGAEDGRRLQAAGRLTDKLEELQAEWAAEALLVEADPLLHATSRNGRCFDVVSWWTHHVTSAQKARLASQGAVPRVPTLPDPASYGPSVGHELDASHPLWRPTPASAGTAASPGARVVASHAASATCTSCHGHPKEGITASPDTGAELAAA